jgi:RNA polymerase nonessential primary-like sigma factor
MFYEKSEILQKYLNQVNKIPKISDTEFEYLYKLIKKNNVKAKKRLIEGNFRLVVLIASKYQNLGLTMMDLIEEGNIGLMRAVEKYKDDQGAKFATYATWWIKQGIKRSLDNQASLIRIPSYAIQNIRRCLKYWEELSKDGNTVRDVDLQKIAKDLNLTVKEVQNVLYSLDVSKGASSLDAPTSDDENLSMSDMISSDSFINNPEEILEREEDIDSVTNVLEILSDKERKIVIERFGLNGKKTRTLSEIGEDWDVSRERIRQIAEEAVVKMRKHFEKMG